MEAKQDISTKRKRADGNRAVMASASFSPNLMRFLRKKGSWYWRVYKSVEDGRWYIGYSDGAYFGGAKVLEALCHGGRTKTWAHPDKGRFKERTEQFWRCAHRFVIRHIAPGYY